MNGKIEYLFMTVFVVLILTSQLAYAADPASTWTVEDIRMDGGWPAVWSIVEIPDGYRMYFTDATGCCNYPMITKSATSTDGLTWSQETGIRIGNGNGGESYWASEPEIMVISEGYRMYYDGYNGVHRIYSAVSTDGLSWTKEDGIRIDVGELNDITVQGANIVKLPDERYRMYFAGSDLSNGRIFSAISTDGLAWTKEAGIRIDIGATGSYDSLSATAPKVVNLPDGRYMMFYGGFDGTNWVILSAVSVDGVTWTKESGIRIDNTDGLPGGPYSSIVPGEIIKVSDSQYRMYFNADRFNALGYPVWYNRIAILSAIGTIDNTPPEAEIRFDPASKDIKVYNSETGSEEGYLVLPAGKAKDGKEMPDEYGEKGWELRQYTLNDPAGNSLVLVLEHKKEGNEARVKVLSLQYNSGEVLTEAKNKIQVEYSERNGALKELEQDIEISKLFNAEAKYSTKKDQTEIKVDIEGQNEQKENRAGIVILGLLTDKGGLKLKY